MIDLTTLFKTITESVPNYIMFITLIVLGYSMCVAFVKVLCENIVKVILAAGAPIVSCVGKEPEKN
jgi:ATP/ADP translocase